jgi:hypothetical protein
MPTPSEDWIQQSLARLEAAEQERQEQERALESVNDAASMKRISAKIDALDAEIRGLYAQLESAAEGGDGAGEDEDQTSTGQFHPQAAIPAPAAAPAAFDDYDPFGASPQAAVTREEPAASYGSAPASYETSSGGGADLDDESRGGAMKWVVMGLLAVGGLGAGGFVMTQQKSAPPPAAVDTGPAQVISASAVPPDTQGPTVAQGADADRIEGTKIRETKRSGGGGGGGGGSRPAPRQKGDGHSIAIEKSSDPLAGLK